MKTTVGKVRKLIREAKGETDMPQGHDGVQVGDWFVGERGGVCQVKRIYTKDFGPKHGSLAMIDIGVPDGSATISQRFDVWQERVHPASPEEIENAQAAVPAQKAAWARGVDTSREGT